MQISAPKDCLQISVLRAVPDFGVKGVLAAVSAKRESAALSSIKGLFANLSTKALFQLYARGVFPVFSTSNSDKSSVYMCKTDETFTVLS